MKKAMTDKKSTGIPDVGILVVKQYTDTAKNAVVIIAEYIRKYGGMGCI